MHLHTYIRINHRRQTEHIQARTHACTQNIRPNIQGQTDLLRIGEDSVGLVDFFVVLVCGFSSCLTDPSHLVGMAAQRSLMVGFFDLRHTVRGIDP